MPSTCIARRWPSGAPNQVQVPKHTFTVRSGDRLSLVRSASATILGEATVKTVEDKGDSWLLTFHEDLPELSTGDGFNSSDNFYNLSEMASPFLIRNCRFNAYRGRGILVSSRNGVIENNLFNTNDGLGVVFSYESQLWADGPLAQNITIRNNKFHARWEEHMPAIYAHIVTRDGATVESRPYKNFRIENNRFFNYTKPVVELQAVNGVTLKNNRISIPDEAPADYVPVVLKNCENITTGNLKIESL